MPDPQSIGTLQLKQPGYTFFGGNPAGQVGHLLSNVIGFITLIAGIAFLFYFMIGSINWITSAGDTTKAQKARSTLTNALIGLVISVIAYPLVFVLGQVFGIPFTKPKELINSLIF